MHAMPDDDNPHFDESGRLIAPKFDDVYFSAEDGLAETRHVFLEGNRLAKRFEALGPNQCLTIGETGFGTGLNFLAAWQLFEQHAPPDARLAFVSVDGLPLNVETIRRALSPWPELERYREAMLTQWGPLWPGLHRFRFDAGRVRLTLIVGQAERALSQIHAWIDAWFLDGFAPARNPAMWSDDVFTHVARLSAPGATLATYTAAGFVRRGLQAVGFEIDKQPGFGKKRDMTVGRLADNAMGVRHSCLPSIAGQSAVVIGASLAGAFVARSLAERGLSVTVIERQRLIDHESPSLAPRVAVLQPKISDIDDPAGRWLREGYAFALRMLRAEPALARRAGWSCCGTFQAATDDRSERRLRRFVEQFGPVGLCRWIDADQTENELGLPIPVGGALIEQAGVLRPAGLCAGLLDHNNISMHDHTTAISLQRDGQSWLVRLDTSETIRSHNVVIANALDARQFHLARHLALHPVRGQVTLLRSAEQAGRLTQLRRAMFYSGGYITPAIDGVQSLGASFVPNDTALDWRDNEHIDVCDKLAKLMPDSADQLRPIDEPAGWVGLRITTPSHRCYAEQVDEGVYVSLGHGSHGIASAAAAAEHLAAMIARPAYATR